MNNPISRDVFDSRDLIDYKEFIADEILSEWNDFQYENLDDEYEAVDVDEAIKFAENLQDNGAGDFFDSYYQEIEHYQNVESFCSELEGYADFDYGATIINERYWEDYVQELLQEVGDLPKDIPSYIAIDWEETADNLRVDYVIVDFEGDSYLMRA